MRAVARSWAVRSATGSADTGNDDRAVATGRLFAVADGVGASTDGGRAATVAVTALVDAYPDSVEALSWALVRADHAVARSNEDIGATATTTLTAAAVIDDVVVVASVGDSRAWLVSASQAPRLLTVDQTAAVAQHLATGDDGFAAANRMLTSTVGDGFDARDPVLVTVEEPVRLVLTTDGVHDVVDVAELLGRTTAEDPSATAAALIDAAHAAGGVDDATAIVVDIGPERD